jgi:hypothetical protein
MKGARVKSLSPLVDYAVSTIFWFLELKLRHDSHGVPTMWVCRSPPFTYCREQGR